MKIGIKKCFIEITTKKGGDKIGKIFGPVDGKIQLIITESGSTFTELSRKLRKNTIIPLGIRINKKGRTEFMPNNLKGEIR